MVSPNSESDNPDRVPSPTSYLDMRDFSRSISNCISRFCGSLCAQAKSLWRDQSGAILSTELILVAVVAVVGLVVGLTSIRDSLVSELADVSGTVQELNQSYSYFGVCYETDEDGNITVLFNVEPTDEGEADFLPEPIVHTIGEIGTFNFDTFNTGVGGSVTGTLVAADGTSTTFTSTTDTGEIRAASGANIGFRESPVADGTFTTTFDDPIADLEFFVANMFTGPNQNIIGNFTVTLSDGTVLNNAAFTIINDTINPNSPVGSFTSTGVDRELISPVNVGGLNFFQDPTDNGAGNQAAGRIVFTDVPPPGEHCVGIVEVSFDRQGGPANFTSFYSFSGRVIDIQ